MITIEAPDGYEACRWYCDGTKSWKASVRTIGCTWWTHCGIIGLTHFDNETLNERAKDKVIKYLEINKNV